MLMVSGHREKSYVRRALDVGARGYVLKGDAAEILVAVERVLAGGVYLSPALGGEPPAPGI